MESLSGKITGQDLLAEEFVQPMSEIQNVIEQLGQALTSSDLNQLGKGIAGYVANGNFYTDSGAADTYVLTKVGPKQEATEYTDGFLASFIAGNTSTGLSTVDIAGLGVKNIIGSEVEGSIKSGEIYTIMFRSSSGNFTLTPVNSRSVSFTPEGVGASVIDVQTALRESIIAVGYNVSASSSAAVNTTGIEAAMAAAALRGGGVVLLPPGVLSHNKLTYPGPGIILMGVNGIAFPENRASSAVGTTLSYTGATGNGITCFYNGCGIRNALVIDSLGTNATVGIQLEPGATPGTPLWQTSSYFEIDNVVVRDFLVQVDADAMSGNDGGWFHRYTNFVFAGRGKATVGSRGVNITSNSASMHFGQVRGCEIGIDQGADKNVFDCELSGCGTGWIPNGGAFSHHIFTTEANTRDLNFNDGATNRDNHVHLLFSNSGVLDTASVPASNQNTMQFGNVFYGIKHRTATATQTGTVLLTFNGGVATLVRNETAGMITSVVKTAVGEYEFTLRKSVTYLSVQAIIMQSNNLRVVVADGTNLRSAGASNKFKVRVYGFDNTTLTELPSAADQGVLIQITNFETDILDI